MNTVTTIKEWQSLRRQLSGKQLAFVPTMGHLHEGHLALMQRARMENDIVVASIFVNPTQFNQQQDFALYPRTVEADQQKLCDADVDYLFLPCAEEMYPDQFQMQIHDTEMAEELEGAYRPGHFTGMLTVVMKLLQIVQPHAAYFGEKDYQQYLLIKKMVASFFIPINIVGCETVRASDGLALSSRNSRLTVSQRERAAAFPRLLMSDLTLEAIKQALLSLDFRVDYITEQWGRRLGAVWLDNVRLIDNISIK